MGLFNEESKEEKDYKNLLKVIKSSNKQKEIKDYLIDYVMKIKNEEIKNDFYEFDFLKKVVFTILETNYNTLDELKDELKQLAENVKFFLPEGLETNDYEALKNLILNTDAFSKELYALFNNRIDYFQIVNLIINEKVLTQNYNKILDYALKVSPYCINQTILKNEILSFMSGLSKEISDIDLYQEQKLEEAKKRCGIYPVDEKNLVMVAEQVRKVQGLIRRLDSIDKKVASYKETIDMLIESGKKKLSQNVLKVQEELIKRLDDYLIDLKEMMKHNSDQVFNTFLNEASEKIRALKLQATTLQNTATSDLLKIKMATEESVETLRKYVEDEPEIKKILKEVSDSSQIKEALLAFKNSQSENIELTPSKREGIIIPGYDRVVVPASPNVIIPKVSDNRIIFPFDETISFDERLKVIMKKKEERLAKGEIFHSLVDEVIICLMEGDWVYLYGPSGCGKSHIIKQVADLLGIDLVQNGKITDKYSIMAYNDPHGRFRATQAFVALTYGKLLSLDEFDNGNTDTQVVLNELYSGLLDTLENPNNPRYITFAEDMTVPINPNFRMISAGNTSGEGENDIFSSRGKIDESVQERMTPKHFHYDNRVEKLIFGEYADWYNLFVNFRTACDNYAKSQGYETAPGMITTRDASSIVKYIKHNSKSVDQILREKFIQTKDENYLNAIANTLKKIYQFDQVEPLNLEGINLAKVREKQLAKKLIYDASNHHKKR